MADASPSQQTTPADARDASEWLSCLAGRFVVFDGPDGSGKTTQFRRLCDAAKQHGLTVCEVREPGGTAVGEHIRSVLLDYRDDDHGSMDPVCEMLLFMASRAQLVHERIRPALERGELVLADRFISSTLAYQGTAGGIDIADIMRVGQIALGDAWPDLVVVFDVDQQTAATRLNPLLDRMEQKGADYHQRVRQGYLDQAQNDPDHYRVIDATQPADDVYDAMRKALVQKLQG